MSEFDSNFARHRLMTLAHILPGVLFMILGPLQFLRGIRSRHPALHRWSGRVFVVAGMIIGISALALGFTTAIGGTNETAATAVFALWFLFSLAKAFLHIRRREIALHREWMIRAFAVELAVATKRPIVATFFGVGAMRGRIPDPHEFFGTAFWIGFTLHFLAAEAWIGYTKPRVPASLKFTVAGDASNSYNRRP